MLVSPRPRLTAAWLVFVGAMQRAARFVGWVALATAFAGNGTMAWGGDEPEPPCLAETQRLCPLVPVGLVQGCLQGHESDLSARCRAHVTSIHTDVDALDRDCSADVARLCPTQQTAAGQRVACLVAHRTTLSPQCSKVLEAQSAK
jgi:hypothetical protein